jgi:hypothetical protein
MEPLVFVIERISLAVLFAELVYFRALEADGPVPNL